MPALDNLDDKPTYAAFGRLVGITRVRVGQLADQGVLTVDGSLRSWLLEYTEHLRKGAAGREESADGLSTERARLARAQADRVEMENSVTRGELAPKALLEWALADVARQAVAILEAVPAQVKRASASIKPRELSVMKREIDRAREAIANVRLAKDEA